MAQAQLNQMQNELNYHQNQTGYPPLKKIVDELEKEVNQQLNQDFSSNNNAVKKIAKKDIKKKRENNYSSAKVKARNFLTNVSYFRVKESDLKNRSFVIDCYTFIVLNLNPFYLERKFEKVEERQYIEMLWNVLMPNDFFVFICQNNNYNLLISTKLRYQDVSEIIKSFCDEKKNYEQLQLFLSKNVRLYQFVYANLFPKYFSRIDDYGIHNKLEFENIFKTWLSQKNNFNYQLPIYNLKEEDISSLIVEPPQSNPPTPLIDEIPQEVVVVEKKQPKKRK